jgi:hypothetical protein
MGAAKKEKRPQHTPGPWAAVSDHAKERMRIMGGDWTVAFVPARHPTDVANARLVAAAPEMLGALERCDDAFAMWQVGGVPGRPEDILRLVTQVRAAIAKARGES